MKPYLIGVAGPSCAGKSYLSTHLARHLNAATLNLDSYYCRPEPSQPGQRAHYNFDSPESLDSPLLIEHVRQLSRGEPSKDRSTISKRTPAPDKPSASTHASSSLSKACSRSIGKRFAPLQATKVFVDLGEEICLERRIERDIRERGRTRESVLEQFNTTVLPMAQRYVHPTRQFADLVLTGDDDIAEEMERVLNTSRLKYILINIPRLAPNSAARNLGHSANRDPDPLPLI